MNCLHGVLKGASEPTAKFQIMSELHLEVGQQYQDFGIPVKAPYLKLVGEIGRLKDYQPFLEFLQRYCANFTTDFLVLGNQEFFGTSRIRGFELATFFENEPGCFGKLRVMNKTRIGLEDLNTVLLGCTLHSGILSNDQMIVQMKVSDFQHVNGRKPKDHDFEHQLDVAWLRKEIEHIRGDYPHRKILVVTHCRPTIKGSSKPSDAGNLRSSTFATELLTECHFAKVQGWIFGHTHFCTEFKRNGVWLVSIQRGYVLKRSFVTRVTVEGASTIIHSQNSRSASS